MQGVPVRIGVDGYARDPGVPAGTGDTDSDFATVGDEHLAHDGSLHSQNTLSLGTADTTFRLFPGREVAHTERDAGLARTRNPLPRLGTQGFLTAQ
ncbi:hypothetical protein GCM10010249_04550 [Streptomyces roseolilacinus]|uniref:Uncharacterized protein n=1 Tax=Streptomyces roseolilacinus TaxID=66904 RepID=A0A918AXJ2_9ACTN|nr:hypothetical protein GCM10010249_04550 [Streptomyces roseolilacinus]